MFSKRIGKGSIGNSGCYVLSVSYYSIVKKYYNNKFVFLSRCFVLRNYHTQFSRHGNCEDMSNKSHIFELLKFNRVLFLLYFLYGQL